MKTQLAKLEPPMYQEMVGAVLSLIFARHSPDSFTIAKSLSHVHPLVLHFISYLCLYQRTNLSKDIMDEAVGSSESVFRVASGCLQGERRSPPSN